MGKRQEDIALVVGTVLVEGIVLVGTSIQVTDIPVQVVHILVKEGILREDIDSEEDMLLVRHNLEEGTADILEMVVMLG